MDLAQPPEAAAAQRFRGFGYPDVLTAFILCVPIALILTQQTLGLGLLWSVGSVIPVSDATGWLSCSSTVQTSGIHMADAWCWRRPLGALVFIPYLALAPTSLAAALVLQMTGLCIMAWVFVTVIRRALNVRTSVTLAIAMALCVPVIWYGGGFGIEAAALGLSLLSATSFAWFLQSRNLLPGLLSPILLILSFQVRPGNALLTVSLVLIIAVLVFRTGRWATGLAIVMGSIATWTLPNLIFQSLGIENAGNAANFWATAYSAVTPAEDSWSSAYERFANASNAMGESNEFARIVRDATIAELVRNPEAFLAQALTNLLSFLRHGFLTLAFGLPEGPFDVSPDSVAAVLYLGAAVLMWISTLAFLILLIASTVVALKQRALAYDRIPRSSLFAVLTLGWATTIGAVGFFLVVGHDERTRHLVQNVPWILLVGATLIGLLGPRPDRHVTEQHPSGPPSRVPGVMLAGLAVVLVILAATMILEGHRPPQHLFVKEECLSDSEGHKVEVVAAVPIGSGAPVTSPSSWRASGRSVRSLEGTDLGWIAGAIANLRSGSMVSLRDSASGQIFNSMVSPETDLSEIREWCVARNDLTDGEKMLSVGVLEATVTP